MGEETTTIRVSISHAGWLRTEARRISAVTDSDYSVDDVLTYLIAAYIQANPRLAFDQAFISPADPQAVS